MNNTDFSDETNKHTFRTMRRCKQQLSVHECEKILQETTSGVLAVLGDNGFPYAVPLSHFYMNGKLYFHSAKEGPKIDALKREAKVSFCVIGQDSVHPETFTTHFRSVIAFGRITILSDEKEKRQALELLGRHFNPTDENKLQQEIEKSFQQVLVLRMDIEHLTGKEAIELVRANNKKKPIT